jgi:2'-5' RNA ligase
LTKSYSGGEISPEEFDFHTTMFYSVEPPTSPIPNGHSKVRPLTLTVKGIDLFGPNKNIPVLVMEPSAELLEVRKYIAEKHGLFDSWPEYKPHLTISYNYTGGPIPMDVVQDIIDTPVQYDTLVVSDIKE